MVTVERSSGRAGRRTLASITERSGSSTRVILVAPVYHSPSNPRLVVGTEADIQRAADDGLLRESHYLELKRELGAKKKNTETARDLVVRKQFPELRRQHTLTLHGPELRHKQDPMTH